MKKLAMILAFVAFWNANLVAQHKKDMRKKYGPLVVYALKSCTPRSVGINWNGVSLSAPREKEECEKFDVYSNGKFVIHAYCRYRRTVDNPNPYGGDIEAFNSHIRIKVSGNYNRGDLGIDDVQVGRVRGISTREIFAAFKSLLPKMKNGISFPTNYTNIRWGLPSGGTVYLNISSYPDDHKGGIPNRINVANERIRNSGSHVRNLRPGTRYRITIVANNTKNRSGTWVATKVITKKSGGKNLTFSVSDFRRWNPNSSGNNANNSSYYKLYYKNKTGKPVRVAVRFKYLSGEWKTRAWFTLEPGESKYLGKTRNTIYYYYAESTDRSRFWRGNFDRPIGNKKYGFRKSEVNMRSWGKWTLSLK